MYYIYRRAEFAGWIICYEEFNQLHYLLHRVAKSKEHTVETTAEWKYLHIICVRSVQWKLREYTAKKAC